MDGNRIAFLIWCAAGLLLMGIGVSAFFSKKAVGFWANIETKPMKDIKKYNRAVGKLFIAYGAVFDVLGLPLLGGQNSPLVLLSILGVVAETIAAMIIYTLVIENKYRAK